MPLYAGVQSVNDRLGALDLIIVSSRRDDPLRARAIELAITDAEALVNSYVAMRYPLPLSGVVDQEDPSTNASVPAVLVPCVVHITTWLLAKDAHKLSKVIKDRYAESIAWLDKLVADKVSLGDAEDANSIQAAELIGAERIFTRETMRGC